MKYPNLRHARAFIEVVNMRSFGAAAAHLHVSQSAISQAIANLEAQIGVPLIDRSRREIVPTRAGQDLLPAIQRLVDDAERILRHGDEWAHLRRGRLRLLTIPSIAWRILPGIIRRFDSQYPSIAVEVSDDKDQPMRQRIKSGEGDLAILTCDRSERDFHSMPVLLDRFMLVCPRHHPLAKRTTVRLDDLADVKLILLKRGTMLRSYVEGILMRLPHSHPIIEVEQTQTLVGMVEAGVGVSLLSALACPTPALKSIVTRPFASTPMVSRQIGFARPSDRDPSPAVRAFVEVALGHLREVESTLPQGVSLTRLRQDEVSVFLA